MSPTGELLAQTEGGETLITATLLLGDIDKARFELPTMRDSNTPLITRLLSKAKR
ncbi:hypothetical protein L1D16_05420 [Vibrio sp. Isolate31]|uniref:hypothetical protein n=1 Tax=unclassified Vibrio TaxID=2614977 RepID=UPI001EFE1AB5|nr:MULTISPECIES: hypothetical protein [unclassified Vibrio]MCG9553203.1 hypothetical protein [Vibrio sp. Isolate32]MCG9600372.1 hypothetical protein [Vibrio sp. Isolate31]